MSSSTPPLRILALDCATATGWATNCFLSVESGVRRFDLKRGESPGMRWIEFRRWLGVMLSCDPAPQVVVFEQPFIGPMRSGTVAEIAYGMATRVQEMCADAGIEFRPVHNAIVKAHATGKGNAGKPEMLAAAAQRWGRPELTDDNEADALCILAWALDGFPEREKKARPKKARATR